MGEEEEKCDEGDAADGTGNDGKCYGRRGVSVTESPKTENGMTEILTD